MAQKKQKQDKFKIIGHNEKTGEPIYHAGTLDPIIIRPSKSQNCESKGGVLVNGKCDMRARAATSKRKPSAKITRRGKKRGSQRDWYPEK